MQFIKKIIRHIKNQTVLERIKYQFSDIRQWDIMKAKNKEFYIHQLEDGVKIKLYGDSYLSYLILRGKFEVDELKFIKTILNGNFVFFDIGSNVGLFSLIASGLCKQVYAFEPTPRIYSRLVENIQINGRQNVFTYNLALSDKNDTAILIQDEEKANDAWNRLSITEKTDSDKGISVKTIKLDDFVKSISLATDTPVFVKIDVEGWEKFVLSGAHELLSQQNVILMIEFNDENFIPNGYNGKDLVKMLENYGYCIYEFHLGKLIKHQTRNSYDYCNLVAAKQDSDLLSKYQ